MHDAQQLKIGSIFRAEMCKKNINYHSLQYCIYRTLQFTVFLTLSNLSKT